MESELFSAFQFKLVAGNILLGTPQAYSMHMRVKRIVRDIKYLSKKL